MTIETRRGRIPAETGQAGRLCLRPPPLSRRRRETFVEDRPMGPASDRLEIPKGLQGRPRSMSFVSGRTTSAGCRSPNSSVGCIFVSFISSPKPRARYRHAPDQGPARARDPARQTGDARRPRTAIRPGCSTVAWASGRPAKDAGKIQMIWRRQGARQPLARAWRRRNSDLTLSSTIAIIPYSFSARCVDRDRRRSCR